MENRLVHTLRHHPARRESGEGISFSLQDKLKIARKLDEIGIHYIEGGWPGSNPKDVAFFAEARHPASCSGRSWPRSAARAAKLRAEEDEPGPVRCSPARHPC